ncbi:hypothetical protein [Clostridium sp. B9]|uniref:hypothetical protein n=1 Tax=Clostridium sp. B9 TaxID=3423224 RepID=UPI003D2ECB3C
MKRLVYKVKGLLGFCQCKKCWHRSTRVVSGKGVKTNKVYICEEHLKALIRTADYIKVEIEE